MNKKCAICNKICQKYSLTSLLQVDSAEFNFQCFLCYESTAECEQVYSCCMQVFHVQCWEDGVASEASAYNHIKQNSKSTKTIQHKKQNRIYKIQKLGLSKQKTVQNTNIVIHQNRIHNEPKCDDIDPSITKSANNDIIMTTISNDNNESMIESKNTDINNVFTSKLMQKLNYIDITLALNTMSDNILSDLQEMFESQNVKYYYIICIV